jgi:hypothetical protein
MILYNFCKRKKKTFLILTIGLFHNNISKVNGLIKCVNTDFTFKDLISQL